MIVEPLSTDPAASKSWDALVRASWNGTFMHTRRFLAYHGDRFLDRSLVIRDDGGELVGVLPAAEHPSQPEEVWSHPGLSYGGIVHAGRLRGEGMLSALAGAAEGLREQGYRCLRYKAIPSIYHRVPASDDLYALFRMGATRYRCDLTSIIHLSQRVRPSPRRRRCLQKAKKAGVSPVDGGDRLEELWAVLEDNLARRHGRKPVHSLDEIRLLGEWFPEEIEFQCALLEGRVVAGLTLFCSPNVVHAQYIAASEEGYEVSALDLLVEHCIGRAVDRDARYFDFGISNEQDGRVLNQGLYDFKNEFGAGSAVHEFYELPL